jgi:hypothetical protein
MADEVLDVAERLVSVGKHLNELSGTPVVGESGWLASAEEELAELIRQIEGPDKSVL